MIDKYDDIINELRGTCQTLDAVAEEYGINPMDDGLCAAVDQEIFRCTECGWWCEMHEEVSAFVGLDEWICYQCAVENHGYTGDD